MMEKTHQTIGIKSLLMKRFGKNGIAPLGYGAASFNTNINYGTNESNKYVTSYFRKRI